jgi:hypothetical protein
MSNDAAAKLADELNNWLNADMRELAPDFRGVTGTGYWAGTANLLPIIAAALAEHRRACLEEAARFVDSYVLSRVPAGRPVAEWPSLAARIRALAQQEPETP